MPFKAIKNRQCHSSDRNSRALMLGFGGVLLYRTRNNDSMYDNVTAIESKPVAKYKVEKLYLIYKDGN